MKLDNNNELIIKNDINNNNLQSFFLENVLGKTINTGIDIGIRTILPDFIEDQLINLKDNLLKHGLKEGINQTVRDTIELGKSAIGIVTGNFDNIAQMQNAIKSGGIIDGVSNVLDSVINRVQNKGLINSNIAQTIKQGKSIILNNVEKNIEKQFENQTKALEKTQTYISNWKNYYKNQNFDGMEIEYKKLEKELKNLVPLEQTLNEARTIENLHTLIKNKGNNFELSNEEIELAQKLII